MAAAGEVIVAEDVNVWIGEDAIDADSSTWDDTPEVVVGTVTVGLVDDYRYKIWFHGRVSTDVAGDYAGLRIREDSVSGTQLQFSGNIHLPTTTGNGFPTFLFATYTAAATASKTFVLTGQRTAGTGTAHRIRGSSSSPGYLVVERIVS
jgi:hypothetical protein